MIVKKYSNVSLISKGSSLNSMVAEGSAHFIQGLHLQWNGISSRTSNCKFLDMKLLITKKPMIITDKIY